MKRFAYETCTEWHGNDYTTTTKVYAVIPKAARDAIAKAEGWGGCHWDAPDVVYTESVDGTTMSKEAFALIGTLGAECMEYDEE